MIRINLLPVREARRKADLRQQLLLIAVSAGVSLVVAFGAHQIVRREIAGAQQRAAQLDAQLKQYKPQQDQVEAYKAKKADIEQKLGVISRLEKSRSGPVHILDELASRTPERVWLTHLGAENGEIHLEGMSLDNELVALFLTSLNDSKYFADVALKGTELKVVDSLKLNTFKIEAKLDSPDGPPIVAPKPAGAPGARRPGAKPASAQTARGAASKEG